MFFPYGEAEISHLKARDRRLSAAIDRIGRIEREVRPELFSALVHSIVGQQISTRAQETVWNRISGRLGAVTPQAVLALTPEELQSLGISFRKVSYIRNAAEKVVSGALDLETLAHKPDEEVCRILSSLDGIGVWTAEMLMTFSMQRPDIISYGDLAIRRGLRMLYRHREITRERFERYRRRYSPYATVASLYLWAIAGGAMPELSDPAPREAKR